MLRYFNEIVKGKGKFVKIDEQIYIVKRIEPIVLGDKNEIHLKRVEDNKPFVISHYLLLIKEYTPNRFNLRILTKPKKLTLRAITYHNPPTDNNVDEKHELYKHDYVIIQSGEVNVDSILQDVIKHLGTEMTINGTEINPQSVHTVTVTSDLNKEGNINERISFIR